MRDCPQVKFIHFCRLKSEERLRRLPDLLGIKGEIKDEIKDRINYILDFLWWWDGEYHFLQEEVLKDVDYEKYVSFFGYILHTYISDDIKTILTL